MLQLWSWANNRKCFLRYHDSQRSFVWACTRKLPTVEQRGWWPKSKWSTQPRKERWNPNAKGPQWESHQVTEPWNEDWAGHPERAHGSKKVGSEQPVAPCAELSRLPTTGLRPVHSLVAHGKESLSMGCQDTAIFQAKYIRLGDWFL